MAEVKHSISLKGVIDVEEMTITEIVKDEEKTYNLLEVLGRFDGQNATLSIVEKASLDPIDEEEE
ncbi:YonK family protein [Exiguobacterium sp. s133]|uniref:YonK family protein n=1 Tax=Exiguobacterium sp. s133 TaxID=2751213 RepID=UPI001BE70C9C|nr:YonK family protein [Exiguobacterium sp. s133]